MAQGDAASAWRPRRWPVLLIATVLLVLAWLPVLGALGTGTSGATEAQRFLQRASPGLLGSVQVALAAVAAALTLGVPAGLALCRLPRPGAGILLAALPLVLPLYLLAIGWNACAYQLGPWALDWLHTTGGAGAVIGGWASPLVSLGLWAAHRRRAPARQEAATLLGGRAGRLRLALRELGPGVGAAAAAVLALALTEATIPSLYRLENPALEVQAAELLQFLIRHQAGVTGLLACLPLAVPAMVLWGLVCLWLGRIPVGPDVPVRYPAPGSHPGAAWLLLGSILAVLLVPPLVALTRVALEGGSGAVATGRHLGPAALRSLGLAAVAAGVALALALVLATALRNRAGRLLLLPPLVLLLVVPAALQGLGLGVLCNRPWLDWLSRGPFLSAVAQALVVLPLVTILAWVGLRVLPARLTEAARLLGASPPAAWARVLLPAALPGLAVALGVGGLLAFTELEASTMVQAPGYPTLPFQVEQLAHYGTNHDLAVAALLLGLGPFLLVPCFLLARWATVRWPDRMPP